MEKSISEKTLISDAVTEPADNAAQLKRLKYRNSALKKELSDCERAAASDLPLLASGLRFAFANEELQSKVAHADRAIGVSRSNRYKPTPRLAI